MLSIKGREPFIRMQLWLNDPTSIEKLLQVQKDKRDASANSATGNGKRKRSFPGGPGSGIGDSGSDRSSPAADTADYSADSPGSHSTSSKKQRVYFTDEQKEALKIAFALDPYPSTSSMEFLSQELGLETRSISNWFHNHRMRLRQNLPQGMDNLALLTGPRNPDGSPSGQGQNAFDPVKFRLLVHQRMLEMQSPEEAAANSSSVTSLLRQFPTFLQSNPTSPLHPASGGLDLSYKRDDDADSIAESTKSGDNNVLDGDLNSEAVVTPQAPSSASSSRSRRKPAAPQWVRPEWNKAVPDNIAAAAAAVAAAAAASSAVADSGNGGDSNSDSGTINGVCVMNAFASEADSAAAGSDHDIADKE